MSKDDKIKELTLRSMEQDRQKLLMRHELPNEHIWGILAHEMTHIWQYAQGKKGGHGKDFYRELLRVGVDETQGWFISDTPAKRLYLLNEQEPILLCEALQNIRKYSSFNQDEFLHQFSRRKNTDAIF